MQTITIDILNSKAMKLLQDLELLQLIRLRKDKQLPASNSNWTAKYKGMMTKQSLTEIDTQLTELRDEWE